MSPDRSARPDGLAEIDVVIDAEIVDELRHSHANCLCRSLTYSNYGHVGLADYYAKRARRYGQLADDVASGRLAELDAIEATTVSNAKAIDVSTNGGA